VCWPRHALPPGPRERETQAIPPTPATFHSIHLDHRSGLTRCRIEKQISGCFIVKQLAVFDRELAQKVHGTVGIDRPLWTLNPLRGSLAVPKQPLQFRPEPTLKLFPLAVTRLGKEVFLNPAGVHTQPSWLSVQ